MIKIFKVRPPVHLCVCPSVCLSVCPSVRMSVCRLSVCLSLFQPVPVPVPFMPAWQDAGLRIYKH